MRNLVLFGGLIVALALPGCEEKEYSNFMYFGVFEADGMSYQVITAHLDQDAGEFDFPGFISDYGTDFDGTVFLLMPADFQLLRIDLRDYNAKRSISRLALAECVKPRGSDVTKACEGIFRRAVRETPNSVEGERD